VYKRPFNAEITGLSLQSTKYIKASSLHSFLGAGSGRNTRQIKYW